MDLLSAFALLLAAISLAFSWSKPLGLPWRPSVWVLLLLAAPWIAIAVARGRKGEAGCAFLFLIGVFGLRLAPLLDLFAPPGGDMTMHLLLSRVALDNAVLPATQSPLYPDVPYGAYPLGFHGLASFLAGSAEQLSIAARVAVALSHTLFAAGLATVLRAWSTPPRAMIAGFLFVLIARNPQAYAGWGGNPCVLGFGFALFAWAFLGRLRERLSWGAGILTVTLFAATVLTHPTAGLVLALASVVTVLVPARGVRRLLPVAAAVALAAALLSAPLWIELSRTEFSPSERAFILEHHLLPPQSPKPSWALLPDYWNFAFGDGVMITGFLGALIAALMGRWKRSLTAVLLLFAIPHLLILFRHSGLPGALALYPERGMLLLTVPWAWLLLQLLAGLQRTWPTRRYRAVGAIAFAALLLAAGLNYRKYFQRPARQAVPIDRLDVEIFDRLAVGEWTVVEGQRPRDAASLLPSLWGIASTTPQWNPIWWDELQADLRARPASIRYWRKGSGPRPEDPSRPWSLLDRVSAGGDTVEFWRRDLEP